MKTSVEQYFKTDRGFSSGKLLYNSLPGHSLAFKNALNRMTETPANINRLHYELAKVVGISERHLGIMLRQPLASVKDVVVNDPETVNSDSPNVLKLDKPTFAKGSKGNAQRKAFVKEKGITAKSGKTVDLDIAIDAWWNDNVEKLKAELVKTTAVNKFSASSSKAKQSVKLFDRFPFLSQDDCPQVFKTVVGELGVTYRKYTAAHANLFKDLTAEDRLEVVKDVVTPFEDNKTLWAELEHYQKHGECLGKHDLVKAYLRQQEIKDLDGEKLAKLKHNLETNINRNKKALNDLEGVAADKKAALITAQETELRFVEVELKSR